MSTPTVAVHDYIDAINALVPLQNEINALRGALSYAICIAARIDRKDSTPERLVDMCEKLNVRAWDGTQWRTARELLLPETPVVDDAKLQQVGLFA